VFDVHVVALIELYFCIDVSIWLHAPSLYLKLHRNHFDNGLLLGGARVYNKQLLT
jgi:hypothetical protein